MIIFDALSREDIAKIVDLQLERLSGTLAERGLRLRVDEAVKRRLADAGYDPAYGARPLRRATQRLLQDPLALELLEGRLGGGDLAVAALDGEQVTIGRSVATAAHGEISAHLEQ